MKKKTNKQIIEKALKLIDWKPVDHGCGHYGLYDNKDNPTDWHIYGDVDTVIRYTPPVSFQMSCLFHLTDVDIKHSKAKGKGFTTLTFVGKKDKRIFIQFYNFRRETK